MARISDLPLLADDEVDGELSVPVVKAGVTKRASLTTLQEAAAETADLAAATIVAASRYRPTKAEGEAISAPGELFSYPDGQGGLVYAERTAGGSVVIAEAATKALLALKVSIATLAATTALATIGYAAELTGAIPRTLEERIADDALSIMDRIPAVHHAAIRDGSITADLIAHIDAAASYCAAVGRPLYFPRGTYTFQQWFVPARLKVLTDGFPTTFKQLDTGGAPKRFIEVHTDGVALWPGGMATIDGGMTPGGVNATAFNSGIRVHAPDGATINTCTIGDVYAKNCGGDGIETGAEPTGVLKSVSIGALYPDNVARNGFSGTAGTTISIRAVLQMGGIGLLAWDLEPDPTSGSPIRTCHIGMTQGHRVSIVGDPAVPMEHFTFDQMLLDYAAFPASNPIFNYAGVSEAVSPALFKVGFRYRNCRTIVGNRLDIRNHALAAIEDIGFGAGDSTGALIRVAHLELHQCGATSGFAISQHKMLAVEFGFVLDVDKPSASTATAIGGSLANSWLRIGGGRITGRVCNGHSGNIAVNDAEIAGSEENILRYVGGDIRLTGVSCTGAYRIFDQPTKVPLAIGCKLAVIGGGSAIVSGGSANAQYVHCSVNGVAVANGWFNAAAALINAADDAAAAAAGVPLGAEYRNGSVRMWRIA